MAASPVGCAPSPASERVAGHCDDDPLSVTREPADLQVALLTGGWDRPYVFGLASALVSKGVSVELIAGDDLTGADFGNPPGLKVLNLRLSNSASDSIALRARRLMSYYVSLVLYAWTAQPRIFHIIWNNGHDFIDRVVLMVYYRVLGRVVYLTAHNVNAGARDNRDSLINRWTLKFQYRLCQNIFVHTEDMKRELVAQFGVSADHVTVVPFGINNSIPRTGLTPVEARNRLGFLQHDRVLLFFGNIAPYKGVEYLVRAFAQLVKSSPNYRLVIAGRVKAGCDNYRAELENAIAEIPDPSRLTLRAEFVPDEETELYFQAADLLVLPYVHIFQSGVLFLGFSFGLPAVVADVGSLKDDIIENVTGFSFEPRDVASLQQAVQRYFESPLARLADDARRRGIIERTASSNSWETVATITRDVYLRGKRA